MKFCIVIPNHESLRTLPAAIESALAQANHDYHVLVSDNGSADGSSAYLHGLKHPRLTTVINKERLRKTDNWNRAFAQAPDSDYVVMLHSDDILYPTALSTLDQAVRRFPEAVLFFGSHDRLTVDGGQIIARRPWPWYYAAQGPGFRRLQSLSNNVSVVGVTFRRDAFIQTGGFSRDYQFVQDVVLYDALAALGLAVYCPAKMGLYRDTPARPATALEWSVEQMIWMKTAREIWPNGLADLLIRLHARGEWQRIQRENAGQLEDFRKSLQGEIDLIEAGGDWRIAREGAARLWKLAYSLSVGIAT